MRQCCNNCYYENEGFCHRLPPKLIVGDVMINAEGRPDRQALAVTFTPVQGIYWCGEWYLDFGKWWRGYAWKPAITG